MITDASSFQLPSGRSISFAVSGLDLFHGSRWVLLSNPLCTSLDIWEPILDAFETLGCNVLRYDAPGHGKSDPPTDLSSTTFETEADDIRALLDHLDIKKLHAWIGVSFGGATAITFAAKYPGMIEKLIPCGVVACSPINAGKHDIFGQRIAKARAAGDLDSTIAQTMDRWFDHRLQSNPSKWDSVKKSMQTTSLDGFETCISALRHPNFDLRRIAAKAGSGIGSALLLVGKDDDLHSQMEELRKGIEMGQRVKSLRSEKGKAPSVELQIVEGGGHVLFVDGWYHFTKIICKFIDT